MNLVELAKRRGAQSPKKLDLQRILGLPISQELTHEEHLAWSALNVTDPSHSLRPIQSQATVTIAEEGQLFAPIRVGGGKTLIGLLGGAVLFDMHRKDKIVFFLPSNAYYQLAEVDILDYSGWCNLRDMPIHLMGGNVPPEEAALIAQSGYKGLYVVPYARLSSPSDVCPGHKILEWIQPSALIFDEAHSIKDRTSARTIRVMDYIEQANPNVIAMSGTMATKSVLEVHHIASACLGEKSPYPSIYSRCADWASVMDANAQPSNAMIGSLADLHGWGVSNFPEDYSKDRHLSQASLRKAAKLRMLSAPGVVGSGTDSESDVKLILLNTPADTNRPGWGALQKLIDGVKDNLTPNGDAIEDVLAKNRWLSQLTAGFYKELLWPSLAWIAANREGDPVRILYRSKIYHDAENAYNKEISAHIQDTKTPGLETKFLIGGHFSSREGPGELPGHLYDQWSELQHLDWEGRVVRVGHPVRVCDYKVHAVATWLSAQESGIAWFWNQEIGRWISELVPEATLCGAGATAHREIVKPSNKKVIASIKAHHVAKNLQHHHNQIVTQFPRTAAVGEQLVGRTDRYGQKAKELVVHTVDTTEFDKLSRAAFLNDALFAHQFMPGTQKAITATYANPLDTFPPHVLRERGFLDIQDISQAEYKQLSRLFKKQ